MAASPDRSGLDSLAAAVEPEPEPRPLEVVQPPPAKGKKRNPAPGIRVVGRRIYDPENGKTCHQCRQKTTDFAASCKHVKKTGVCTIKYCKKCLLNRYGEKAEEAAGNDQWTCPKCRGICNCSFCRKKLGKMPTGIMAHIAKASGCTSVHDLLEKGSDVVAAAQATVKVNAGDKQSTKRARQTVDPASGMVVEQDGNVGIDINAVPTDEGDENIGVDLNAVPSVHIKKKVKREHNVKKNSDDGSVHEGGNRKPMPRMKTPDPPKIDIVLPKGTLITNIAGIEMDNEVVGAAIQFCEFCRAFAEFFQIRKGQPEKILQDIVGGRELRSVSSQVAKFHITLLSIIQEGKGKKPPAYKRNGDAWVIDIGKCIEDRESSSISQQLPVDCLSRGVSGYKNLSPSFKLRVLNFLCDEALCTNELKKWIDVQITEPMNAAREKARAAKEKEKELRERLPPNVAENIEEHKSLISQIEEVQEVKRAALKDMTTLEEQAYWKPLMIEKGLAYWKLEGYCDDATILLQDFGDELTESNDKWYMFTKDEEKVIEEYISTRNRRQIRKRIRV